MASGKFVWKTTKAGKFSFNLVASNGQVIATSQSYDSKSSCMHGMEAVRKAAAASVEDQTIADFKKVSNPKFEIYKDKAGEFRFRLKARNGENIVASEGYASKSSCKNGIASVGKNAPTAEVVEAAKKK